MESEEIIKGDSKENKPSIGDGLKAFTRAGSCIRALLSCFLNSAIFLIMTLSELQH
jgi:hypothetical protein